MNILKIVLKIIVRVLISVILYKDRKEVKNASSNVSQKK